MIYEWFGILFFVKDGLLVAHASKGISEMEIGLLLLTQMSFAWRIRLVIWIFAWEGVYVLLVIRAWNLVLESSYVSFFGDVLKFFRKRMDLNIFRYIRGFWKIKVIVHLKYIRELGKVYIMVEQRKIVLCCERLPKMSHVSHWNPINSIFFLSVYSSFIIMIL